MDRRKTDIVMSAVLSAISVVILVNDNLVEGGMETDLGSMFLPRLMALFILAFSFTIAGQAILKLSRNVRSEQETVDIQGLGGIAVYMGIFALYWFVVPYIGFIASTPFVMVAIMLLLGGRNWLVMIPLSVISPILVYYGCYNYLRVMLPVWSL